MRILVTGAAGFIGSRLCEVLLAEGHEVFGVDGFVPNYPEAVKRLNLANPLEFGRFTFIEGDLSSMKLDEVVGACDGICHLAGLPGVRTSWDDSMFTRYLSTNVSVTERLLRSAWSVGISRFVYASSSSIYGGTTAQVPLAETAVPRPSSPYAVTKLAGEQLTTLFATELGLSAVSLRFFTVFGPRQRPDMAIYRMIQSSVTGKPFRIYGDGRQQRDFTYVDDVVDAIVSALQTDIPRGLSINVGGAVATSLLAVIKSVESALGCDLAVEFAPQSPGDPSTTLASTDTAQRLLGWSPAVPLAEGVQRQVRWQRQGKAP